MIDNQEDRAIASHRSGALRAEPQGSRAKPPAAIAGAPEDGITATQIVMGHGFVDVGPIYFGDRKGIILRPRPRHIPVGDAGELNGDYWPVPGDVVIWIDSAGGADTILEHLTPFGSGRDELLEVAQTLLAFTKGTIERAGLTDTNGIVAASEVAIANVTGIPS